MFAEDNFIFDENGGKFSKLLENHVGKGEIACYVQFLLFSQCFQKTYTADIVSLLAAELEEPKIGLSVKGLSVHF